MRLRYGEQTRYRKCEKKMKTVHNLFIRRLTIFLFKTEVNKEMIVFFEKYTYTINADFHFYVH